MKKKLVVYLAGMLTVLSVSFGSAQFSDVPAGHWAKEAVERITACGLITGFPDGTYRGNTNLTRYQAALIFQRLLNELKNGGECVAGENKGGSMSEEDMAAIRNAVQELASELAALGVRVSALEDNAASKDDIARLDAAIEELKTAQPQGGMDEAAMADLADRVEAASVAADTALAQAQILAERLDTVEANLDGVSGDVAALKTQVEADADSIRALNELAVLLNQDVLSLQDRVTAVEKQIGDVDFDSFANKEDVGAIQEFATALRGDLVKLSDKVTAIDARVAALEAVKFSLTGNLSSTYGYWATTVSPGPDGIPGNADDFQVNFDIDRLFPGNALSSGAGPRGGFFRNTYRRVDTGEDYTGVSGGLTFGLKFASGLVSEVSVSTGFDLASTGTDANRSIKVNSFSIKGTADGQAYDVKYTNDDATFRFNPYLFSNNAPGDMGAIRATVANITLSKFVLSPKVTLVIGSAITDATNGGGAVVLGGPIVGGAGTEGDFFGLRTQINLLGLDWGFNYAENKATRSAFGLDWNGKLFNFLNLEGAYINSKLNGTALDFANSATNDQAFYVTGGISLGILDLSANYRAIDPSYENGVAGMSMDQGQLFFGVASGVQDAAPFATDNRGFGVDGTIKLGFLEVKGYYDNSTDFFGAVNQQAFGVGAKANLFAGFSLMAYYNNSTEDGVGFAGLDGRGAYGNTGSDYDYNGADYNPYTSGFGVRLKHDGKASNALIKDLNLLVGFDKYTGNANTVAGPTVAIDGTDLQVGASYSLKLGFLKLDPAFRYHSFNNATAAVDSYSTIKFGITAATDPLFLGIALDGAFGTRSTDYATSADASEMYWRAGLTFNSFLAAGSTFKVGYANYTGTNIRQPGPNPAGYPAVPGTGYGNALTNANFDNIFAAPRELFSGAPWDTGAPGNAVSGGLNGLYAQWDYAGFTAAYFTGILFNGTGAEVSRAQGFKLTYNLKF